MQIEVSNDLESDDRLANMSPEERMLWGDDTSPGGGWLKAR